MGQSAPPVARAGWSEARAGRGGGVSPPRPRREWTRASLVAPCFERGRQKEEPSTSSGSDFTPLTVAGRCALAASEQDREGHSVAAYVGVRDPGPDVPPAAVALNADCRDAPLDHPPLDEKRPSPGEPGWEFGAGCAPPLPLIDERSEPVARLSRRAARAPSRCHAARPPGLGRFSGGAGAYASG